MISKLLVFILIFLFSSRCGLPFLRKESQSTHWEDLEAKYSKYAELSPKGQDHWLSDLEECDALLFYSLAHAGLANDPADLRDFERSPGEMLRRPDVASRCGSSISRDMLLGVFVHAYVYKDLELLERIWEYGSGHMWKMGMVYDINADNLGKVMLSPQLIGLLARLIYHLGGDNHEISRALPAFYTYAGGGFRDHLNLLQIYLEGRIAEQLSEKQVEYLRKLVAENTGNTLSQALLHQYTDGNMSIPINQLLDIWPDNRLPNSEEDWKEPWRPQRADSDAGLRPGLPRIEHSGGDFLFISAIILEKI